MRTRITSLIILVLFVAACGEKPKPVQTQARKDPRLTAVEAKIAQTTPEGKQIIEKALTMKAEVNEQISPKPLGAVIDEYAKEKGDYNITPIGWEATQKKARDDEKVGRWKIVFHYQTYDKQVQAAEWEYNPATDKLYPFDKNASEFWPVNVGQPETQAQKGKL